MQNLERVLAVFREAGGDDWSLRQIVLFVRIGIHGDDGITLTELSEQLDISQQATDRNCKAMALRGNINKETGEKTYVGYGLIEFRMDIYHAKRWNVRLTSKGKELWNKLTTIVGANS